MPICGFCGKDVEKVTEDHVPPKCMYGGVAVPHPIKVPSCGDCNWGTSKNDEFLTRISHE